jgi:hypothetical protein
MINVEQRSQGGFGATNSWLRKLNEWLVKMMKSEKSVRAEVRQIAHGFAIAL